MCRLHFQEVALITFLKETMNHGSVLLLMKVFSAKSKLGERQAPFPLPAPME